MGQMWLDCFVLPQMESLRTSRVYHQRILALHMIVLLIKEEVRLMVEYKTKFILMTRCHDVGGSSTRCQI